MNLAVVYDIVYALAALGGREQTLFGPSAPLAHRAFERSCASPHLPEIWFETPLSGEPWFDLHVGMWRENVARDATYAPDVTGGHPEAFEWFASQGESARQLFLSWDVGSGDAEHPAIQLLLGESNLETGCDFLAMLGRPDAAEAFRAFLGRIPEDWFACYVGLFPSRPDSPVRVECIPYRTLQQAYASDPSLLEAHFRQVGLEVLGDTLVERCQQMARFPFEFELQFDVQPDGTAGATVGASSRFACPPGSADWGCFDVDGAAGQLMGLVESWGLADERWRLLGDVAFAKRLAAKGEAIVVSCYPAFVKVRWRNGEPLDAKTYVIAGEQ